MVKVCAYYHMVTDYRFEVLSAEDSVALKEELMTSLLKDYEQEIAMRAQEEAKINSKAKTVLKSRERLLYKPSQTQYYSSMCVFDYSTLFQTYGLCCVAR